MLKNTGKTWSNSNRWRMMTNSAFLISKFLKFYGEESEKELINSNTSSNTKAEATCTVTGSMRHKSKDWAVQ
jgi:hypothetical protein